MSKSAVPKGTGYGGHQVGMYGLHHHLSWKSHRKGPPKDKQKEAFEEALRKRDLLTTRSFQVLASTISAYFAACSNDLHGTDELARLLLASTALDISAEILRNDSLEDAVKRKDLYCAVLELVTILTKHVAIMKLVRCERPSKRGSKLLRQDEEERAVLPNGDHVASLRCCMVNLVKQCRVISRNASIKDGRNGFKDMLDICQRILPLADTLDAHDLRFRVTQLTSSTGSSTRAEQDHWINFHRDSCFAEVPDELIFKDHAYGNLARESKAAPKGRMKRLIEEGASLSTSLPQGIFVRYAENRPDVMKALIVGTAGTPYESGLFEFDFWATEAYPSVPPKCTFRTTGNGRAHFNPNLYECGKVCLSLLGTWSGERWRPGESTILQILVSLQAMVLCDEPWFNEPGREHSYSHQKEQSLRYNKDIQVLTVRWAISDFVARHKEAVTEGRKMVWQDVVERYLESNREKLRASVTEWAKTNPKLENDGMAEKCLEKLA